MRVLKVRVEAGRNRCKDCVFLREDSRVDDCDIMFVWYCKLLSEYLEDTRGKTPRRHQECLRMELE